MWLIYIPWHFPLENHDDIIGASSLAEEKFKKEYPIIYNHLLKYKDKLSKRNFSETGIRYEWYALQRWGSKYRNDFNKQKLVWTPVNSEYRFCIVPPKYYINNSLFMIVGDKLENIYACFNSSLYKFYLQILLSNGAYAYGSRTFFLGIPIKQCLKKEREIIKLVNNSQFALKNKQINRINQIIFEEYELTDEEITYIEKTSN